MTNTTTTTSFLSAKLRNRFDSPVAAFSELTRTVSRDSDVTCYGTLVDFATLTGGTVNETTETLAKAANMHPRTFQRARLRLAAAGMISITDITRERGGDGPLEISVNKLDRKYTNRFNALFA